MMHRCQLCILCCHATAASRKKIVEPEKCPVCGHVRVSMSPCYPAVWCDHAPNMWHLYIHPQEHLNLLKKTNKELQELAAKQMGATKWQFVFVPVRVRVLRRAGGWAGLGRGSGRAGMGWGRARRGVLVLLPAIITILLPEILSPPQVTAFLVTRSCSYNSCTHINTEPNSHHPSMTT